MDMIHIKKLEVFANHGVHPEENALGQKFIISADLFLDLQDAGETDDLTASVHYGHAAALIKDVCENTTFKLIEGLAEKIAHSLLIKFPVERVRLVVEKPWAPVRLPLETVAVEVERGWHTAYLSIGSNMGNTRQHLDTAIAMLNAGEGCRVMKTSSFLTTKPYGGVEQADFLNACLEVKTILSPYKLLDFLHEIENSEGRERIIRWGPRTLDLDILLYDEEVIYNDVLKIPHIDMHNRQFVLEPLYEIAPYAFHPVLQASVLQLRERLYEKQERENERARLAIEKADKTHVEANCTGVGADCECLPGE